MVYLVTCGVCGIRYVGKTGQHFCERRSQHQRDVMKRKKTHGFYFHIRENQGHKIDWEKVVFLTTKRTEEEENKSSNLHKCHKSIKYNE